MLKQDFIGSVRRITFSVGKQSALSFLPDFGATPTELHLALNGQQYQIFDGFKTEQQILSNEKSRCIFLIPFPNRVRNGKFSFEGRGYQLPLNKPLENNAIHGFIWNRKFAMEETEGSVILSHDFKGDFPGFPFSFLTRIQYDLSASKCAVKISVSNTGEIAMPLGIGWHPYFRLQKQINELYLQLPACKHLVADGRMIPTGRKNAFSAFQNQQLIGNKTFDDAFEFMGKQNFYETCLTDKASGRTIIVEQDAGFKYLQAYTPPDRNSIALEPMTCPANAFNSGEGLIKLLPGETYSGVINILLR